MTKPTLEVLLVEDNAGDALLFREMFEKETPGSFVLTHLLRMSDALSHLAKGGVDIVLLDMGLPDGHGLDTVRRAHAAAPGVPLIVLTGLDDEVLAAEALREGAQDYLIKGQIENRALPRALRHAIERHRMQTEADLVRTNQMQFKDEFLSHVSHELRSPMTAIHQFTTILLDGLAGEMKPEQHKHLGVVLRNVKQLQSMIDDLLEVTRLQAGKLTVELQSTSIADAVAYTMSTFHGAAAAKGIMLSSEMQAGLPLLCADPTRTRQVLIVLVDNAIKFTPAGGTVRIGVRLLEKDPNLVIIAVEDSGCGFAPELNDRIFERLYQASDPVQGGRKGLGLGLYICRELVTRQGGHVWARSEPGKGAVFSVVLPVFSLPTLIAPVLRKERRMERYVTLVVTELGSQTGWLSNDVRTEHTHGVRDLLQRCLHPDLDVLLPKMSSTGAAELFFVVAATDAVGGEAITTRIRERVQECRYLQDAGLILSTSFRSLDPIRRETGEEMSDFQERVAVKIQKLIDEEVSSRMS